MKILHPTSRFAFSSFSFARRFHRFAFAGFCALAISFAPAVGTGQEEPEPTAETETEEALNVLGVIRTPAPKELSERLMSVARKLMPGPQTESLPFMLGGMLGDPMLEGVSATDNMGIALIERAGEIQPVFILKLTEESPLRQSLPNMDLRLRDFEGWTFGLRGDSSADWVAGAEEALIAAVEAERRYDIELRAAGNVLAERLREAVSELPQMGGVEDLFVRPLLHGFASEADSMDDVRVGLDLSGERIRQVFYLKAASETPLAAFLDQKPSGGLDFARFIPGNDALRYAGGFDVAATQRYFAHFFRNFEAEAGGEQADLLQSLNKLGMRFLESTDGRYAGGLSFENAMQVRMTQVSPSSLSDEELAELLQESVRTMSGFMTDQEELGFAQTHELLRNHLEVSGVPVHVVRTETKIEGEQAAYPDLGEQRQDMLYALAGGYLVNTTSVSRMTQLIDSIRKDEAVEGSLASVLDVDSGKLLEFQVDLLRYFGGAMGAFSPAGFSTVIEQLQGQNLAPVTGGSSAVDGVGEFEISVPVDTIAAIYRAFTQQMGTQQNPSPVPPQE